MNNSTRNQTHTNKLIMLVLQKAGVTKDCSFPAIRAKVAGVKIGKVLLTTVQEAITFRNMYIMSDDSQKQEI